MTTITIDRTRRATLKRLLERGNHFILVNANGDITNLITHISFDTEAPAGTWHSIYSHDHRKAFLAADEFTADESGLTIRTGHATRTLDTEPHTHGDNPARAKLDGPQLTIHSGDGHNREAFPILASTASTDDTLPTLTAARITGNAPNHGPVTAVSTDRYTATLATLTADSADVTAILPNNILREIAARKEWTITTTATATMVTCHDIGLTATQANMEADYPPVEKLFPDYGDGAQTFTAKPKHLTEALKSLAVGTNEPAMLTINGTVYAENTPEVPVKDATSTEGEDYAPLLGINPRHILRMTRAAGARWDSLTLSWHSAFKPISMDWGNGIIGLFMPVRSHLPRPEAAAEAEPVTVGG